MTEHITTKTARVTPDTLSLLKRVAEIEGHAVSDLMVAAAQKAAQDAVAEPKVLQLSRENQERFLDSLLNPPEPTEALQKAFARHHKLLGRA